MKKLLFAIACALTSFASFAQLVGPQPWLFTGPQITIGGTSKIALLFGMSGSPIDLSKGGTGTFSRASTATVTDWGGIVRSVKSGEMRMSGWRRVENLLQNTEDFTLWTKGVVSGSLPTVLSNQTASPNGSILADYIIPANASISSNIYQTPVFVAGVEYSASVYLKSGGWSWVALEIRGNLGDSLFAWFDLSTGTVGTVQPGLTATISFVGNGWYRCNIVRTMGANVSSTRFRIYPTNADNAFTTGDGINGIYAWGASVVEGLHPEYVSNGVLSSPYHGVGVDGVKYFSTDTSGISLHPTYYEPAIKASVWATYKPWTASESTLSSGSRRIPSQNLFPAGGNGYWYYVSTFASANTGATEPTWPTTIGATVADSSGNTWTNGGYYRIDGYLAEPQRTNLGRYGNDPTNVTYWANVDSTPTLNSVQSPDGRTNSTLITEGSAGTAILAQSVKTVSAGSRQAMGVWLKRGNTDWVEVGMRNTGATNGFRVWVNLATGAVGTANTFGTATNEAAYVEMKGLNSHWRVVLVGKLAAGDTTAQPYVRSASADGTSTRVNGATYYQYRLQHVTADSITSDIPNDGATDITRVVDSLTWPADARLNGQGSVLASARSELARLSTYPAQVDILGTGSAGRFLSGASGAGNTSVHAHDGTNTVSNTSGSALSSTQLMASYWTGSAMKTAKNNTIQSGSFDGGMAAAAISLGGGLGGSALSGTIRSAAILTIPPTDVLLQSSAQWHNY